MESSDTVVFVSPPHMKWGSFLIRGLLGLLIGIIVLLWTDLAVETVVILFAVFIALASILSILAALRSPAGSGVLFLLLGVLGIIVAALAIFRPFFIAMVLVEIVAVMMLLTGIFDIALAASHPEYVKHRWLLGISGVLSLILGIIFILFPLLGAVVLVAVYLGIFMILYGILSIAAGVIIRGSEKEAVI